MIPCPHGEQRAVGILCRILVEAGGPNRIGGTPHPCEQCQTHWESEYAPPATTSENPYLVSLIEQFGGNSGGTITDPTGNSSSPPISASQQRPPCDHLGKIINRLGCNCQRRWIRECDLLKIKVSQSNECQQCEHWTPAS